MLRTLIPVVILAGSGSLEAKPKHIGANWDNTKSYVERGVRYHLKSKQESKNFHSSGEASWYCCYRAGTRTADGTLYDPRKLTAAHKTLPFGTLVKVTNVKNHKSVIVEITDRGPYSKNRIIDLTPGAFAKIESKSLGVAQVKIKVQNFKY